MNITAKIPDTRSAEDLIERARSLVPALRRRAAQTLAERKLPQETIADFRRLGLTRCLQPAMFGGYGSDYRVFSKMLRALAQGCGSSAWVAAVHGEHNWVIGNYPEEAQREVWGGNPDAVASASVAPNGTAEQVSGSFRLSGRWGFASNQPGFAQAAACRPRRQYRAHPHADCRRRSRAPGEGQEDRPQLVPPCQDGAAASAA
jgi:3-hydroxy-9,10-secoandrosta-1,3,5(10)-triene-9,17-dione monooxygenase